MQPYRLTPAALALGAATEKPAAIAALAAVFADAWRLDAAAVRAAMLAREALGSTGFGRGVALPHARIDGIDAPLVAVLRTDPPVDFAAADGQPVALLIGLVSPAAGGVAHLHALAALSRLTRDDAVVAAMLAAGDAAALHAAFTAAADRALG